MSDLSLSALILAAGKGTRMKSNKAKVLHEVFFAPMVHHVLDALESLPLRQTIVVTGYQRDAVEEALEGYGAFFVVQEKQLGTGHAVLCAEKLLRNNADDVVLIVCGDTPLIRSETLTEMLDAHRQRGSQLTLMTTMLDDPTHYGRILSDEDGSVKAIIEEKDATDSQRAINEVNAGIYIADSAFLFDALQEVGTDNKQGEVYLTDIVSIAKESGLFVNKFICKDYKEVLGVNSRAELALAHELLQMRRNKELMALGVTLVHPETICVEKSVTIGADTIIHPNVFIHGDSWVGSECLIEPFSIIGNSRIGNGATVGAYSHLVGREIDEDEIVQPHTALSP